MPSARSGALLVNLGTPASTSVADVRHYLREFLSDPRVIDIPAPARFLLLEGLILPFRPRRSAEAYAKIWGPEGSPLLVHGRALRDGLAKSLGEGWVVELGMRYGEPSIEAALDALLSADVERLIVLPLFPQYASASGGSAAQRSLELLARRQNVPELQLLGAFYDDPGFVGAIASLAAPRLAAFRPDFTLFSYHGLPERQIRRGDASGRHCLASAECCARIGPENRSCYRAQCFATSRALVSALGLAEGRSATAFQSRLGRTPWIRPYTDQELPRLAERGVRRLAVLCPSFVADCLETLEEVGIRAREQWAELGGEELLLLPCLNAETPWVETVAAWLRTAAHGGPRS